MTAVQNKKVDGIYDGKSLFTPSSALKGNHCYQFLGYPSSEIPTGTSVTLWRPRDSMRPGAY